MDPSRIAALTIGVIGLGRMGTPIAQALSTRFPVSAFDIDPRRQGAAVGVSSSPSLEDLAAASNVVVTVLPGPRELRQCMTDLLPVLRPGTLWLDLTSGDPAVTREIADEAERYDVEAVSAPMGGSVADADARSLVFFVSGTDLAVAKAVPILEVLSREGGVRRAGTRAEDGQIVKLLANGLWFANAIAASEAMLIGQGLGLAPADLRELLRDSAGGSRFLDEHAGRLLDGDYLTTFGIDRVVEELDTITTMSATARVRTPMLETSARLHHTALERFGPVLGELLAVKMLEHEAGQQLRR